MDKVRVGIIGLGIGQSHYGGYSASPNAELVAICDRDEKWLKHCQDAWGVKHAFTKLEDLVAMDELDAVSVCLPTIFHDPVTIAALKAGKHVLCEKPMAHFVECIIEGKTPIVTPEQGVAVTRILDGIYTSTSED